MKLRILFAGTPEIAVPTLQGLAAHFTVVGVLTNPDRVRSRGRKVTPSPVKACAEELGIPVIQPEHLYREAREQVAALRPDILVSFAYGRIFGPKFLALFPYGGVNVHPSLLPRWRGSTPIPAAILAGDAVTGITIQQIAREMDTGDILEQLEIPLTGRETTASLSELAARLSPALAIKALAAIASGNAAPAAQQESAVTYCGMLEKSAGLIDWQESATTISRKVRAFYPWPKTTTRLRGKGLAVIEAAPLDAVVTTLQPDGTLVTAWQDAERRALSISHTYSVVPGRILGAVRGAGIIVVCGEGSAIGITRLQPETRNEMDWHAYLQGDHDCIGRVLGMDTVI